MISRSEATPRRGRAGLTLFETLVSLAILALVAGVTVAGLRGPSPQLRAKADAAAFQERFAATRLRAMRDGVPLVHETELLCAGAGPLTVFADGSARGGPICIGDSVLTVAPLSGTFEVQQ